VRRCKPGDLARAVAYVRVSTNKQDLGPKGQRAEIAAWARTQGVRIVRWRVERVSGATPIEKRPRLLRAIRDLRELGAGRLLVWKRDRFIRADAVAVAAVEQTVKENGGELTAADGVSNGNTPEAQLVRRLLDAVADYERTMIGIRTALAAAVKRRRGEYAGGEAPFGSAKREAGRDGDGRMRYRTEPDPAEARTLALIENLASRGLRAPTIAKVLNGQGVRCRGSRWHTRSVSRILARFPKGTPDA